MNRTVATLLVAALVMLAGCAGGIAGPDASGAQTQSEDSGTVNFYVSDEKNAIEDFEHLNVTITKIGFQTAGDAEAEGDAAGSGDASKNETENGDTTTTENTTTDAPANETTQKPEQDDNSDEQAGNEESEEGDSGDGEWVERQVDSRTVDLTELQGANATILGNMSVPPGEYEQTFVYVSDVNGTLKTGEQVDVKLPSQKLQLKEDVTVNASSSVDFVFDITVFEAGNSGKYLLKPVASESGTDVEIDPVDGDEGEDDESETELEATVVGEAKAGEEATVEVTRDGDPLENATVSLNGEVVATTSANGTATVQLPADVEEAEIEASTEGEAEGETELELEFGENEEDEQDDNSEEDDKRDDSDENSSDSDENETAAGAEADLAVALDGTFAAGENVTLYVTDSDGKTVEDATVAVDGNVVGETNTEGQLTFTIPDGVSVDSEITVTSDEETVTIDARTVAAAN